MLATALAPIPLFMRVNIGYAKVSNTNCVLRSQRIVRPWLYFFRNSKPVKCCEGVRNLEVRWS